MMTDMPQKDWSDFAEGGADKHGWFHTSIIPPEHLFDDDEPDYRTARILVWIKGQNEPSKGRCVWRQRRDVQRYKWYADGYQGDWEITHWQSLPPPPEDST